MDTTREHIIKQLILLRSNNYVLESSNVLLTKSSLFQLVDLSVELIGKLHSVSCEIDDEWLERIELDIDNYRSANPRHFVFFVGQVVQYYTAVCDDNFTQQENIFAKIKYLQGYEHKLGNIEANLLIAKYIVIHTYNQIVKDKDEFLSFSIEKRSGLLKNTKADLQLLDEYLQEYLARLNLYSSQFIDTHFISYLKFLFYYCYASLIELRLLYSVDKQPDDATCEKYLLKQRSTLEASLNSLKQFEDNYYVLEPFYFGCEPFHDFPLKSCAEIKSHLKEILELNNNTKN